jgi:hypothetical protein
MDIPAQFGNYWDRAQWRKYEPGLPVPPMQQTDWALFSGLLVQCELGWPPGQLTPAFRSQFESCYLWRPAEAAYGRLVVHVQPDVHALRIWRSLGSCLRVALALRTALEVYPDNIEYDWVVNFEPLKPLEEQTFYVKQVFPPRVSGEVKSPYDLRETAGLIELLLRDERFYWSCSNLLTAHGNHAFCAICAYAPKGSRKHPDHELDPWHVAVALPAMEVAVVQATRAVEGLVGKPGQSGDSKKRERAADRWRSAVDIDPAAEFLDTGESYLSYYSSLFGLRGKAAHSLGRVSYEVSRRLTIQSQVFALEVLVSYAGRHGRSDQEALSALGCELPHHGGPIDVPLSGA